MPLFEYKCASCEHLFERIEKHGARRPKCPQCGGKTERQLSAPAIQFKGTGWYLTDYARKGKDSGGESKDSGGESKDSGGESKDSSGESKDSGGASKDSGTKTKSDTKPSATSKSDSGSSKSDKGKKN